MRNNIVTLTDSYKLSHYGQYPPGTTGVFSYFESREGAQFPYTVFFGLQHILLNYGFLTPVTMEDVDHAERLAAALLGPAHGFNRAGWENIVRDHHGRLPVRINAVPEGTVVPTGNVLMTVENLDPAAYWLTNYLETILVHAWYPSTVATLSRHTIEMIGRYMESTASDMSLLPFMLHDFGFRGAVNAEAAGIGGAAHLLCSLGTDTLAAMETAIDSYGTCLDGLAASVPATEHSVMTAEGREGEPRVIRRVIERHPTGIVSCVGDSYDIYNFVRMIGDDFKEMVLARDGKFVVRPDSSTATHPNPGDQVVAHLEALGEAFGTTTTAKGYAVLDPHVGLIWGDGIDPHGIEKILATMMSHGWAAQNCVFGMGGGLLQKVNRDTQRFAFKSSAQERDGKWIGVGKDPLDKSKRSKKGRLKLVKFGEEFQTLVAMDGESDLGLLRTVYANGELLVDDDFDTIRKRAALPAAVSA